MTTEERRAALEKLLEAGDMALELIILRWTDPEGHFSTQYLERRKKFRTNLGREESPFSEPKNYYAIVRTWGSKPTISAWPLLEVEEFGSVYTCVEDIIADALALGFIDQAMQCSRAWEQSK